MSGRDAVPSPQTYARFGGLLYLVVIITGAYAELGVRGQLVVTNDVAATAHNIMAHQPTYRLGFVAEMIELLCNVPLMLILYELFKFVNKRMAVLVVFFSMVGTAVEAVNLLNHLAPLSLLGGGTYLAAIPVAQLQAQAYLSLRLYELGFAECLVFFGFFCVLQGVLIFRSGFMPKFVGVLLGVEGVCYLINSFVNFLAPQYAAVTFSLLSVSVVGEVSLCLWLLLKGVNVTHWKARMVLASS